uniref:Uncharacterized protein n=1 Tax=Arundo donax TaxID=35708 RepID=A0A0A8Z7L8_ARUDO
MGGMHLGFTRGCHCSCMSKNGTNYHCSHYKKKRNNRTQQFRMSTHGLE